MEHKDVKRIAEIEKESFSTPWSEDSIMAEVDNPNSLYLIYENSGYIIGYIGMYLVADEVDINNIAICKDQRKKGYGIKLLQEAINQTSIMGYKAVTLEVRESNLQAIELYKKFKFVVEGKRKNFYTNPVEDGLIMWKR